MLALTVILAAGLSFLISLWFIRKADAFGLIDVPNERSSHDRPKPKGGGIGIVLGVLVAVSVAVLTSIVEIDRACFALLAAAVLMAVLGFYSDRIHLSPLIRIIIQVLIAAGAVAMIKLPESFEIAGWMLNLGWGKYIFAVIWLVAITNFYNFMDGIDGLAAAQGIFAGCGMILFGIVLQRAALIPFGLIIAGATAGFLILNMAPSRIFMGDAGSYFLGFLFAGVGLLDARLLVPVGLALGVFIFDTVVTLARRILRNERWYQAHCSHFYQRTVKLGYSHVQVTGTLSAVFISLLTLAILYLQSSVIDKRVILVLVVLELSGLAYWIIEKEQNRQRSSQ